MIGVLLNIYVYIPPSPFPYKYIFIINRLELDYVSMKIPLNNVENILIVILLLSVKKL